MVTKMDQYAPYLYFYKQKCFKSPDHWPGALHGPRWRLCPQTPTMLHAAIWVPHFKEEVYAYASSLY